MMYRKESGKPYTATQSRLDLVSFLDSDLGMDEDVTNT
jgi:hypothetical protein